MKGILPAIWCLLVMIAAPAIVRAAQGSATPVAAPGVVVVAAGDIACGQDTPARAPCQAASTAALAESLHPDAVLLLGDIQYECGELADFKAFFDPYWGHLKPITHPAVGHHEYQFDTEPDGPCYGLPKGAPGYWTYFGAAATPREPNCRVSCDGYYSFDLGAWHIIALNSVCQEVDGCEAGSPEDRWLRDDLAAHPADCTLAYMHAARFSSGRDGDADEVEPFWQALADHGADLVIAAHDHNYERFSPMNSDATLDEERGIRSFVVGTGGRSHLQFPETRHEGSVVANDTTFGVLRLDLHDGWYEWEFVPVTNDREAAFSDSGSARCHP